MSKHSITLKRAGIQGFLSSNPIAIDALNALVQIPGVEEPEIVRESHDEVELTYTWVGETKFWETREHLLKFGLCVADGN